MNRTALYRLYDKIERTICPGLKYSQYFYEDALKKGLGKGSAWLDLGCGHHVLPLWRGEQEKELVGQPRIAVGLDYDLRSLLQHRSLRNRVRGVINALPFREGAFDLVTANMVVEHLDSPDVQYREIFRTLKPGGVFIFHTPNAYGYTTISARVIPEGLKASLIKILDGRPSEDVFKTYYRSNTESQIRKLAQETGFEVVSIRYIASSAKFAVILPLAFLELFWIKLLLTRPFRSLRTNLVVTLGKPSSIRPAV